jgi:hypothetical protein
MKSFKTIKRFIDDCFSIYDIDPSLHFFDYDEDDFPIKVPIFENNRIEEDIILKLSEILGLNEVDIINADRKAMKKIYNKYAYFKLKEKWKISLVLSQYEEGKYLEVLRLAIFDTEDKHQRPYRYDYNKIKDRLIMELLAASKYIPELFHKGAEIENLRITTEVFSIFPEIKELVHAFFEVMDRLTFLFFTAWNRELTEEEKNEYNLFVSHFKVTDIVNSTHYLYYSTLKKNRDIYKAEGYNELLSYVRIGNSIEPWRCREFFDDVELVEQFLNRFPDSRFEMRMFLNKLLTFTCEYNWSDMIEPKLEIDNNDSIDDINLNDLKKESEKLSEYYKVFYLKKTEEDLGNDLSAALTMQTLLSPPKMGGVKIKYSKEYDVWWHSAAGTTRNEYNPQKEMEKMIKRIDFRRSFKGGLSDGTE